MQSINNFLQKSLVMADKICDYFPYYSMYNNIICLVAKGILSKLESYSPTSYTKIQDSHLVRHLEQKNFGECILLSIPYLNIFVAVVRDFPEVIDAFTAPSAAQQQAKQALDDQIDRIAQQTAETRQKFDDMQKQRNMEREAQRKQAEEELQRKLEEYDSKIADLPDTEEGEMRKKLMERLKESFIVEHQARIELLQRL